ncbi:MAG: hypothetical protein QM658_03390 [Gordonia sp. (in: high G+C Gram-positive bacteria)]
MLTPPIPLTTAMLIAVLLGADWPRRTFDGAWDGHQGEWAGVLAMALAAVVAGGAWGSQVKYSRKQEARSAKEAAITHAGEAARDLTTGDVAIARDKLATWATDSKASNPRSGSAEPNAKTRHRAFVLLWALHRLSPLSADVHLAEPQHREVIRVHVGLILKNLADFKDEIKPSERGQYGRSAAAAKASIKGLVHPLEAGARFDSGIEALDGFPDPESDQPVE